MPNKIQKIEVSGGNVKIYAIISKHIVIILDMIALELLYLAYVLDVSCAPMDFSTSRVYIAQTI